MPHQQFECPNSGRRGDDDQNTASDGRKMIEEQGDLLLDSHQLLLLLASPNDAGPDLNGGDEDNDWPCGLFVTHRRGVDASHHTNYLRQSIIHSYCRRRIHRDQVGC